MLHIYWRDEFILIDRVILLRRGLHVLYVYILYNLSHEIFYRVIMVYQTVHVHQNYYLKKNCIFSCFHNQLTRKKNKFISDAI